MASNLLAMASNLLAMAQRLTFYPADRIFASSIVLHGLSSPQVTLVHRLCNVLPFGDVEP